MKVFEQRMASIWDGGSCGLWQGVACDVVNPDNWDNSGWLRGGEIKNLCMNRTGNESC